MEAVFSNNYERLADALAERLFAPESSPFERRFVLVQSEQMKDFLLFYLSSRLHIAAGMHIGFLEQGVIELLQLTSVSKKRLPSFLELSLAIEGKIRGLCQSTRFKNSSDFSSLFEYITSDKRVISLADQLAHLFLRYGQYGDAFLSDWLSTEGWQQYVWKEVFSPGSAFTFPLEAFAHKSVQNAQLHVFGFDHLPLSYLSFFARSRARFYQFSPCEVYWEDVCSDKERLSLIRRMQLRGANKACLKEMEHYVQERHPLLANWGRLGREFLKSFEHFDVQIAEHYVPATDESTLLQCVQQRILMQDTAPCLGKSDDVSIQIHSAVSKLKEVEALKEVLYPLLAHIEPKEVLVLAPDIALYAPYIHMVFGSEAIAYRIEGLEQGSLSEFVQAFFHLLSLAQEELSLSAVFKLFLFRPFREKWGFSLQEAHLIHDWLKCAHVRSGKESWRAGLDRLLWGLCMTEQMHCIAHSDIPLFNAFLVAYETLEQDITELASSEKKSLAEWLDFLQELAVRHFSCDEENEPLLKELKTLRQGCETASKWYSFASIQRIIAHFYEKRNGILHAPHLQRVVFCSLKEGACRPARIVYLLGMDEEGFPRCERNNSLCALTRSAKKPYFPVKGDRDRYLFLQLLCLAKDYFILSYERVHSKDNKPQGPSYLIEELRTYCALTTVEHPFPHCADAHEKRCFFAPPTQDVVLPENGVISISSLRALAKNPIKFYFNEVLGMYLEKEEEGERSAFCLSQLDKYLLKRAVLHSSFETTIKTEERKGSLPEGLFKEVAIDELSLEMDGYAESFRAFNLSSGEIYSAELSLHCREPLLLKNGNWVLPALAVPISDATVVHIVGKLTDMTPKGYFVHGKKNLETLVSMWPSYLIFLHVRQLLGNPPPIMLFSKDKTVCETHCDKSDLTNYLTYYFKAKSSLSPFFPKWANALLKKEAADFEKAVHASLQQGLYYTDPYLEWMKQAEMALDAQEMFAHWAPYLRARFALFEEDDA